MKQVMFVDLKEPENYTGGILTDNGDVICGCCGALFKCKDRGMTWAIVEEYDNWVSFSEEIIK